MTDFSAAADETFQILRSFDYTVGLYDEQGNSVEEPKDARRFYAPGDNLLTTITDDGENSALTLSLGKRIETASVLGLIQTLRTSASKFNLLFHVRRYGRDLSAKDFTSATMTEAQEPSMNITEGLYGTSRSSYLKLDNARMIVRHSGKIDEKKLGARGRAIDSIFIENKLGERALFPTKNLAPARAMTHHVNNGGDMKDAFGSHITEMAHDYARLGQCARHVQANRHNLEESAVAVGEACRCKMRNLRRTFERCCRPGGYQSETQRLADATPLNETTPSIEPTKLDEMRRLLCGAGQELDEDVIEAACRASNEAEDTATTMMNQNEIEEGAKKEPAKPTVSVLGKKVHADAWQSLANGSIDLFRDPMDAKAQKRANGIGEPTYRSLSAEIEHKLNLIVPCVKDDTLLSLLSEIGMQMPFEEDRERKAKMFKVAVAAIRAAGMTITTIPTRNAAVKEFAQWMSRFRTVSTLNEDTMTPRHLMGDNPFERDTSSQDNAVAAAVRDFDIDEFVLDYVQDSPESSFENQPETISREALISAIEDKLLDMVESTTDDRPMSLQDDAEELLPKVVAALEQHGVSVADADADADANDLAEALQLSREDVLLPRPGQGEDLRQEVIARHDHTQDAAPTPGEDEDQADADVNADQNGELARMRTLSGL